MTITNDEVILDIDLTSGVPCEAVDDYDRKCENEAEWNFSHMCCGACLLVCDNCRLSFLEWIEEAGDRLTCILCKTRRPRLSWTRI